MFKLLDQIKKTLLYAGVDKQDYENVKPYIIESNRKNLGVFTGIATVAVGGMILLSFIFPILASSRESYIVCVAVSFVLFLFAQGPAQNKPSLTYVGMYTFAGMLLAIGIVLGTMVEPRQASTSFAILMFAVPLWFTDIPLRVNLMTICSIIIYFFAAMHTQDTQMLTFNESVVFPYGALCIIASILQMRMKVHSFVTQYNELLLKEDVSEKEAYIKEISNLNVMLEKKQENLELAKKEAETANAAKTTFLFNMSHDIRTPMNAIVGYTDLIEKYYGDKEKCMDYLHKVQDANAFLLTLINNVLEMSRIESGKTDLDETPCHLGDIAKEMESLFEEQMHKKNIVFTSHIDIQTESVLCDQSKIREIYLNILSNAVKYTPIGGNISMSIEELPSNRLGYALLKETFSDTGIGMSKEFLPHLFEEFTRAQTSTESRQQGTGLGMPIVKKLIELMGGTIEVESELGKGSTFIVTLYLKIVDTTPKEKQELSSQPEEFDFTGKRILLAEDNDLNAEIAEEILKDIGLEVERAEDGVICVDMLQKAECGYYDLILMDIQMPNMDGYKATQTIRALKDPSRNQIPIVAMTANAFEEDKKNAFAAGMNGHLAKPIEIPKLMAMLVSILKD